MKSNKELLNDLAKRSNFLRELTNEESSALKKTLLDMYVDFSKICEEYNLTQMLSSGSCLGAIRHNGFIPWDDDVDIMMPRSDYEKLKQICELGVFGDKYEFSYPNKHSDSKCTFMKIFKVGTINREVGESKNSVFPTGAFLDVFVLDNIPSCKLHRRINGIVANGLRFISNAVSAAKSSSVDYDEFIKDDKALVRRRRLYKFIGSFFSLIPHKKWTYWFDSFVSSSDSTRPVGMPAGRHYYGGEMYDSAVLYPPQKVLFEGTEVFVPAKCEEYLTSLYGDYMKIPPVEKREQHFVVEFKL